MRRSAGSRDQLSVNDRTALGRSTPSRKQLERAPEQGKDKTSSPLALHLSVPPLTLASHFTRPWLLRHLVSEPPATHGQSVGPDLPLQHLMHGKRQASSRG